MSDLAQVITAVAALVVAMGTCTATILVALRSTSQKVDAVMGQVTTLNESTLGQLAAAIETVRIQKKEAAGEHITANEQRHVAAEEEA